MASERDSSEESEHYSSEDENSEKKNHASDKGKKSHAIDSSSPYYLGSSDNLGTPLVAAVLNGENYRTWSRSMKTTL